MSQQEAFGNRDRDDIYFFNIMMGKAIRFLGKIKPEKYIEGLIERVNKKGEKVYEIHKDYLKGYITSVDIEKNEEFGDNLKVVLRSGKIKVVAGMKFNSAYGRSFLTKMMNIDLSKMVELEPFEFQDKKTGKDVRGILIFQDGNKILSRHTKENPNGMPPLKSVIVNNKETWDSTEQIKFLLQQLDEFKEKVISNKLPYLEPSEHVIPVHDDGFEDFDNKSDDLPY